MHEQAQRRLRGREPFLGATNHEDGRKKMPPDTSIATDVALRTKYLALVKEVYTSYRKAVREASDYGQALDLGELVVLTKGNGDPPAEGTVLLIPEVHSDSHQQIYPAANRLASVIMGAGAALSVGVEEPTYPDTHSWLPNVAADPKNRPDVIAKNKKLFVAEPNDQASVAYQLYTLQVEGARQAPAFVWQRFPAESDRTGNPVARNHDSVNTDMAQLINNQRAADRIIVYPVGAYHLGTDHNATSLVERLANLEWDIQY
jgi:hypothetical protein